jgi:hypothetical protein
MKVWTRAVANASTCHPQKARRPPVLKADAAPDPRRGQRPRSGARHYLRRRLCEIETTAAGGRRAMNHGAPGPRVSTECCRSPGTSARQLKSGRHAPIVISAHAVRDPMASSGSSSAPSYLVKPFSLRGRRCASPPLHARADELDRAASAGVLEWIDCRPLVVGSRRCAAVLETPCWRSSARQARVRGSSSTRSGGNTDTVTVRAVDSHVKRLRRSSRRGSCIGCARRGPLRAVG